MENNGPKPYEIPNTRGSSIGHFPQDRWVFDHGVVEVFDDMLARSIPQIESMRTTIDCFAQSLIKPGTDVIDLGCACGEGMERLIPGRERENRFVGVDVSAAMLNEARRRFNDLVQNGTVELLDTDLRFEYPKVEASLTLCILTLQFIPVEHRPSLLKRIWEHTTPGGGLIMVEKILGSDAAIDSLLVDRYYSHKRAMGYSQEEIDSKKRALEGVLVPLTTEWNEQLLRNAGFRHIECVWRCMNFCGWLALL